MGAAVAVCVAMLLRSGDVDVISAAQKGVEGLPNSEGAIASVMHNCTVVSFASPAVVTLDLSLKCQDYVTSVVAGKDVIPRLCYASVRRLLRRLNAASPAQPMLKSIGGAFREVANGLQNSSRSNSISETTSEQIELTNRNSNGEANKTDGGEVDENADDAPTTNGGTEGAEKSKKRDSDQTSWQDLGDQSGLELRDHSGSDFLVQPGRVIHLRRLSSQRPVAQPKHATAFTDIPLSTRMMTDHIPMVYESAILEICERMKAERMETMHEVANRFRRVTSVDLMNSPSRHHPTRGVLSPGSEFKRSVAEGAKNKKEKQSMLANAAPRFGEEEEKGRRQRMLFSSAAEKTTTSKTEETTQTSNSKGWQVVRNFFSTMMSDSPTGDYDKSPTRSDDENTLLDGDDPNDKDDKGQIVDEFHAAAASAAYNSAQR
jgi:chromatin remodeling complex protein RSC6